MTVLPSEINSTTAHYTIRIPGSAPVDLSKHILIDKNHQEFDIFSNASGFHNHFVHHYLSAFAFGADMKLLQDIFDAWSSFQRPIPSPTTTLTRDTYRKEICNRDAYTSYLNLFKDEIEKYGMIETVCYWIFKDEMLAQLFGGAYHPLIHLGYAIEFNLSKVAAEALAMMACTTGYARPVLKHVTDKNEDGEELKEITNGNKTVMDIIQAIYSDTDFDDVVKYKDELKSISVTNSPKAIEKLRDYASQWHYKDAESSLEELFIYFILVLVTSGIREQGIKLDFFLAHAVTSIYSIYIIFPYLTPIQAELLLRTHFAQTLMFYVARGRPSLQLDLLENYKSPQAVDNNKTPWLDVIQLALNAQEAHCIKVIRAIATAQTVYGNPSSFGNDILLKAAQVTVDITGKSRMASVAWNYDGIGFKEAWE
ncbi:hypothetical protein INT45_006843 [Circinella minor]|uniref:Oxidoreductase AflY n=1 Tax=Circinella minor TaxID=1195481 RepID=A0A8H7RTS5_9FUNG|nr:hypothetical protein INT45_006843 [Circinella minor]